MFRYVLLGGLAVALTMSFASTAEARNVLRHESTPPGLILPAITTAPGATVVYRQRVLNGLIGCLANQEAWCGL